MLTSNTPGSGVTAKRDYAASRGIPIAATKEKIYSRDANLWHLSHEGGNLENPNSAPKPDMFMLTAEPAQAPDTPQDVVIGFERGTPVTVNGKALGPVALIAELNAIGGRHGVGRTRNIATGAPDQRPSRSRFSRSRRLVSACGRWRR